MGRMGDDVEVSCECRGYHHPGGVKGGERSGDSGCHLHICVMEELEVLFLFPAREA